MIAFALALYAHMAPIGDYLMPRGAEIHLARSAAPRSISDDATVVVLGPHGYEIAVAGKNGFVCLVERGWIGAFDFPEFWSPRIRGADCLNLPAARSILPLIEMKTRMLLAGDSRSDVVAAVRVAYAKRQLPSLSPGAMSYMMARASYLTDAGDHNGPHLMFYMPFSNAAPWGADLPGSPLHSGSFWFMAAGRPARGLPALRVFVVDVPTWSDGTTSERAK